MTLSLAREEGLKFQRLELECDATPVRTLRLQHVFALGLWSRV